MKQVTIRLDTKVIAALQRKAEAEGRSFSNVALRILQSHVYGYAESQADACPGGCCDSKGHHKDSEL